MKKIAVGALCFGLLLIAAKKLEKHRVRIVDRKDSHTEYSYFTPGYRTTSTTGGTNCTGGILSANCTNNEQTTTVSTPPRSGKFRVQGATLALRLEDGRIAVVNCEYKPDFRPLRSIRSCRIPLADDIDVEFDGDKAKLFWSISLDGSRLQSETYKILGILDRPSDPKALVQ